MDIVSCRIMGGLGNYMFQISAAYALSLRDNKKFICDYSDNMVPQKHYSTYTNNIFRKIEFTNQLPEFERIGEHGFNYRELPKVEGNVKIFGYFQSEKYFKNYRNEILELFKIDEQTNKKLQEKYSKVLSEDTCSIHVRRGDYIRLSDFHYVQDINYYKNAYQKMGEEKKYLIFSDDMDWCKQNFDFIKNKIFIENSTDFEDLYLMSFCKNNIVCNSTFSWWGAWLNENPNKKVIIPKNWFGPKNSHLPTDDLYCKEWVII